MGRRYELEGETLEALTSDAADAIRAIRAALAFAEELPPRSRITQDLMQQLHTAESKSLAAWRNARHLRRLVHEADGGRALAGPERPDPR